MKYNTIVKSIKPQLQYQQKSISKNKTKCNKNVNHIYS